MAVWKLRARESRDTRSSAKPVTDPVRDPEVLRAHCEDAAHFPGGHATALYTPDCEAEIADVLRSNRTVLPIGAQSSLTGGATPMGDALLSTRRLNRIVDIGRDAVRVQAGVPLIDLDRALSEAGRFYPPAPTFAGAFLGGTVSTNASGAATFKYGSTRQWVDALTVVLPTGDVLDVVRGRTRAHPAGYFELELAGSICPVPVPSYVMPATTKLSAGYFAEPGMDLIDLFIGSEGTLGVITEVTLRVLQVRPAFCLAFVPFGNPADGLACASRIREVSLTTRRSGDRLGVDACAIEHMDRRSIGLLHEDQVDRRCGVPVPADTSMALLVTIELPAGTTQAQLYEELGRINDGPVDTPLGRFSALLEQYTRLDNVQLALPGETARAEQLLALREGVPAAVNRRVGEAQRRLGAGIEKTAADAVVAFDRFEEFQTFCIEQFQRRGLDAAIWGHISDGNTHPNLIPHSRADVDLGKEAVLAIGREAIRLGGAPLAEHGVGRNRVKQQLVQELYGDRGVDEMRRVKQALDPDWKLAPGVLFPKEIG